VNHIFFHGIPYSPADAPWPGWQFYAAVNFGPQGGLWHDLPEFNAYVTRCQSILQAGEPDNDLLVYYPVHDVWNAAGDLIRQNPIPKSFTNAVSSLWRLGYAFDYLSDRFLAKARCEKGRVMLGGNGYAAIFVPVCSVMPATSMKKLAELAQAGATVLFQDQLPGDVPGWGELDKRRMELQKVSSDVRWELAGTDRIRTAGMGKGALFAETNLEVLLRHSSARREPCVEQTLRYVRRRTSEGFNYFIANRNLRPFSGWLTLSVPFKSAAILDPRSDRAGVAACRQEGGSTGTSAMYLQLWPNESAIVRVFTNRSVEGQSWPYRRVAERQTLPGDWKVKFIEGGPELPAERVVSKLGSWTESKDPETERFAGTARYSLEFELLSGAFDDWSLDLGQVCDSARVRVNGHEVAGFWCAPFKQNIGAWLQSGKNLLEVDVTNLAANRIADMDRRKVKWKYFYDINMASKRYRSLDASEWPVRDSGLLGPVTLTPMTRLEPR